MLLASCSNAIKQKVGIETAAPDELQVQKQRPLYVPPHYELPEPPTPQLDAPEVKKKSGWMFWKKDKVEVEPKIKVKSEEVAKPAAEPKKKWFWQKSKVEAKVEPKKVERKVAPAVHKVDKSDTEPKKKKHFWQREKKAATVDVIAEKK